MADFSDRPDIPDHQLDRVIGEGSYGVVWLATNIVGGRRAIKVVPRSRFATAEAFDREFRGVTRYERVTRGHRNLVQILHVGRTPSYYYYVMELADPLDPEWDGDWETYQPKTLSALIAREKDLDLEEALTHSVALASGLNELHSRRLIHRDIKPSNVIFVHDFPKLADVGLVGELGSSGSIVGTEGYLAPEGPGSEQADIYAFGKLMYEMATGQDRLQFPSIPLDLAHRADLRLFREFNDVFCRACEPNPKDRYLSVSSMRGDLLLIQAGESAIRLRRLEKWFPRIWRIAAVFAVLMGVGFWNREVFISQQLGFLSAYRQQRTEEQDWPRSAGLSSAELGLRPRNRLLRNQAQLALLQCAVPTALIPHAFDAKGSLFPSAEDLGVFAGVGAPEGKLGIVELTQSSQEASPEPFLWTLPSENIPFCVIADGASLLAGEGTELTMRERDSGRRTVIATFEVPIRYVSVEPTGRRCALFFDSLILIGTLGATGFHAEWSESIEGFDWSNSQVNWTNSRVDWAEEGEKMVFALNHSLEGDSGVLAFCERVEGTWRSSYVLEQEILDSWIYGLIFHPMDQNRFLAGQGNGDLLLFEVTQTDLQKPSLESSTLCRESSPILSVEALGKTGYVALGLEEGALCVLDIDDSRNPSIVARVGSGIDSLLYFEDQRVMAGRARDGAAWFWDLNSVAYYDTFLGDVRRSGDILRIEGSRARLRTETREGSVTVAGIPGNYDSVVVSDTDREICAMRWEEEATFGVVGHFDSGNRWHETGSFVWPHRGWYWAGANETRTEIARGGEQLLRCTDRIVNASDGSGQVALRGMELWRDGVWVDDVPFVDMRRAAFIGGGSKIVMATSEVVRLVESDTHEVLWECPLPHPGVSHLAVNTRESLFIVCYSTQDDEPMYSEIREMKTGIRNGEPLWHEDGVLFAKFSPDGKTVVTCGEDDIAQVWNVSSGKPVGFELSHTDEVRTAAFSLDGRVVATGGADEKVQLWVLPKGERFGTPLEPGFRVSFLKFVNDGRRLVAQDAYGQTAFWDIFGNQESYRSLKKRVELASGARWGRSGRPEPASVEYLAELLHSQEAED